MLRRLCSLSRTGCNYAERTGTTLSCPDLCVYLCVFQMFFGDFFKAEKCQLSHGSLTTRRLMNLMKPKHLKQRLYASSEIRLGIQIQSECSQVHIHLNIHLHKAISYMVYYRQLYMVQYRTRIQQLNTMHSPDSCRMFPTTLFIASGFL